MPQGIACNSHQECQLVAVRRCAVIYPSNGDTIGSSTCKPRPLCFGSMFSFYLADIDYISQWRVPPQSQRQKIGLHYGYVHLSGHARSRAPG